MFYVLPWDPVLRKDSLSLFNMYFYHDILWPPSHATKFFKSLSKYSHPGQFQEVLTSLPLG